MERFPLVPLEEDPVIEVNDPNEVNFEAQLKRARMAIPVISNRST